MKSEACIRFLQWALPQLEMRWAGYRKVRNQVCKRIDRRLNDLGLDGIEAYRAYLEGHREEWRQLDSMCRITISRFGRDRGVFAKLAEEVLPSLARSAEKRGDTAIRVWSAGCASGEEPYTLAILWALELEARFPALELEILATDADPNMIRRAGDARYGFGSLRDLPGHWRDRAFRRAGDTWCLEPGYKGVVDFHEQDIRHDMPDGPFDLVLCRNLVFTYFDRSRQADLLARITSTMRDGAALVIGVHETLPAITQDMEAWFEKERIYRLTRRMRQP